jgi:hypothetical protein
MGGPRSGNRYHSHRPLAKITVEGCLDIDANLWGREGIIRAGAWQSGVWTWTFGIGGSSISYEADTRNPERATVRLAYSWRERGSPERHEDYHVRLTTTRPHFGGRRWWFVCPLVIDGRPCNRRAGKLYLPPDGRYFGCRRCYDLTYTSCQQSHNRYRW